MAEEIRRMRQKYGTTAQWGAADPVLTKGEIGYEDLGDGSWLGKLGDGLNQWSALPYYLNLSNAIPKTVALAAYSLTLLDSARDVFVNAGTAAVITIPINTSVAFPIGSQLVIWKSQTNSVNVVADVGVTLNDVEEGILNIPGKNDAVYIQKTGTNTWVGINGVPSAYPYRSVTSDTDIELYDVEVEADGNIMSLPSIADVELGKWYLLRNSSSASGDATVAADGTDLINGFSSIPVPPGNTVRVVFNGTSWQAAISGAASSTDTYSLTEISSFPYTALSSDQVIWADGTGTINLPAVASLSSGKWFRIVNVGTGTVTIDPDGSETINGSLTEELIAEESLLIMSNGTEWRAM